MAVWPKPESNMIPAGHYVFRLREEPEFETWDFKDKNDVPRTGRKIHIKVVGSNENGDFDAKDNFPVWDRRYTDLCVALGVEHGPDIQMAGAVFEADIQYDPDKKDPMKSWPHIYNIIPHGGDEAAFPDAAQEDGQEIPF